MSTFNAQNMADKLFTKRHNYHMSNITSSMNDLYQDLLNQYKGPEAFELSVTHNVPVDVLDELKDDGFIVEDAGNCITIKLPEGVLVALDEEESEDDATDTTGVAPEKGPVNGPGVEADSAEDLDPNDLP